MAIKLQLRRGTTAENDLFTGALAEVTVDTNKHKLRVHDGSTQGGFPVALESDITDRITNCITEIPQDIILEINGSNGLTIKSGSKLYQPNGSGTFTPVAISGDKSRNDFSAWTSGTYVVFRSTSQYTANGGILGVILNNAVSGATDTSTAWSHIWYDTTNNKIKLYEGGSYTRDDLSFPIAIITIVNGTGVTSIDQVFNGFGYIGSTVFALPGVKGLIPNGRNADGTLKNAEFVRTAVGTLTFPNTVTGSRDVATNATAMVYNIQYYDEKTNIIYTNATHTSAQYFATTVATVVVSAGVITGFIPKFSFRAVDYSDYIKASGTVVAEQLPTSANNYTWYRKYANGWVEQGGKITDATTNITLSVPMANDGYTITIGQNGAQSGSVRRAAITSQSSTGFVVENSNSAMRPIYWHALGLAA